MSRTPRTRGAALLGLFISIAGCAPKAPERPDTVSLHLQGGPPDARVTIDDEIVGTADVVIARGVALPVGQHRITVERQGYFPCDKLVVAKAGEVRVEVECKLVPVPD